MKSLASLNHFFIRYKWHFLGGLLFIALSTIFKAYQGIIIRDGTNEVLRAIDDQFADDNSRFLWFGIQMVGFALLSGVFMFLMRQTIIVMSRHIEYDQKNEIFSHYQQLDAGFYKMQSTGDLMNRISEDVSRVRMYTGPAIMYLVNTMVTVVTLISFMLSVNPELTLYVFIPMPVLAFIIYKISNLIGKRSLEVQSKLSELTTQAQESFSGIRLIKAYGREAHFSEEMLGKSGDYKNLALRLARTEALFGPTMMFLIAISTLITVWYGGKLVIENKIDFGNITEFIYYIFQLTWPFASLGWVTSLIQRAAASQQRINEFMDTKPAILNKNPNTYTVKGEIEFRNVSFTYLDNQVTALRNISFHLPAGKTLGITGGVGSGKSTLLQLLSRLYDVSNGEILIDGKNIKEHNLHLLRQKTGVVPQEIVLFSDTIANNISFGSAAGVSREGIIEAAKQANIHENITRFSEQYETIVGERGVTLSGGQKQRVSIARAIIHQPQMLMFDDCLSAVDSETEHAILEELKQLMKGKTSVIVSHRISGIQHADLILYLKDGQIIESGSHNELLALKGEYYKLNQLQKN